MKHGKLAVAGLAISIFTGCSQFSEPNPVPAAEVVAAETTAEAQDNAPMPVVELNASTKPPGVEDQRPIKLPLMATTATENPVVTQESFEFGNDAPLAEGSVTAPATTRVTRAFTTASGSPRFAPTYPDRPIPSRGMMMDDVLASVGEPANRMTGNGSEVWDYGTYRVFFSADEVAFTSVW